MTTTSKLTILFLLCLTPLFVSGCGNSQNPSALMGKWSGGLGDTERGFHLASMELLKDGTGTAEVVDVGGYGGTVYTQHVSIKWRVVSGRLNLELPDGVVKKRDYKISGKALTLSHSGGNQKYEREK